MPLTGDQPRISIITAVYDVARYLDDFIASIENQTYPAEKFEVVAVDDGSTDDCLARLHAWAERSPIHITVLTKTNGGQSTARNLGLEHASGEWVTFTDPDDTIADTYLAEVDAFLEKHPTTTMIATRRIMLDDATGEITDSHPLKHHFERGNRLRVLSRSPVYFHGSAPAAFFRRSRLQELGLRFDPEVRPNFEDGHFCCRYLMAEADPSIGFVATADYRYRKRADASSTLNRSLLDPDRYTNVLENGYLPLLRDSAAQRGHRSGTAAEWLQTYVVYELSWYFTSHDSQAGISALPAEVNRRFHAAMRQISPLLDERLIESFKLRSLTFALKMILAHGFDDRPWHQLQARVDRFDREQRLVRVRYLFTGCPPVEEILADGVPVVPAASKNRAQRYYGADVLHERILWIPSQRETQVLLDGESLDLNFGVPRIPNTTLEPRSVRHWLTPKNPTVSPAPDRRDRVILGLAAERHIQQRFKDAWVLMDRIHNAGDSGEILFRYLRRRHKKINAWFVVERSSPDYKRLRAEGYRRVVAHGSTVWKLLMLNAQHVISSHADQAVIAPPEILRLTPRRWRFTFLQHGVIKDDLSAWLNGKAIDLMMSTTAAEHASLTDDATPYELTTREVKRTGLPRFDRLLRKGSAVPPQQRDLVLVTPTWREWLLPKSMAGQQRRGTVTGLGESEFFREWRGLLASPWIAEVCREQGLTLSFLPHPNLEEALPELSLPSHVQVLRYEGADVQDYFARAAAFVTDYSSVAFNAAYLGRPVVYFQFDAARALTGGHIRSGYFDYERDGFGPVCYDHHAAVTALVDLLRAGRELPQPYATRVREAFGTPDGRCCKRVTEAILASTRPARVRAAEVATP